MLITKWIFGMNEYKSEKIISLFLNNIENTVEVAKFSLVYHIVYNIHNILSWYSKK